MRLLSVSLAVVVSACRPPQTPAPDAGPPVPVSMTIAAGATLSTPFEWGLLHGVTRSKTTSVDVAPLIRALEPKSWRLSNQNNDVYGWVQAAQLPAMGTRIVWTVQDSFMISLGVGSSTRICVDGTPCPTADAKHFASFAELRTAWRGFLATFVAQHPAYDWYDVFSEPDNQVIGVSRPDELVLLYLDAEQAIRARYPQAKLVAPSYVTFSDDDERLVTFARAVRQAGGTPDALSWHEFGGRPLLVGEHTDAVRAALCDAGPCPEFHVNEYEAPEYTMSPGREVAWLSAFQRAGVHFANRACWDVTVPGGKGFSTCWDGFTGMLDERYRATQSLYWVHERFAQLARSGRFIPVEPFERIDVAARRLDGVAVVAADMGPTSRQLRLLVGNFGIGDAAPVTLELSGFPHLSDGVVNVTAERYPMLGFTTVSTASVEPEPTMTVEATVTAGRVTLTLPLVRAGEAWGVLVAPK